MRVSRSLTTIVSALVASLGIGCSVVKRQESSMTISEGIISVINDDVLENIAICILRDFEEVGEYAGVIEIPGSKVSINAKNDYQRVSQHIDLLKDGNFDIIDDLLNELSNYIRINSRYFLVVNGNASQLMAQLSLTKQAVVSGNEVKQYQLDNLCDLLSSFFDGTSTNNFNGSNNRINFHIHPNATTTPSSSDLAIAKRNGYELIFSYIPYRLILRMPDGNLIKDKIEVCVVLNDGSITKRQYNISNHRLGHLLRMQASRFFATGYNEDFDLSLACLESFKEERVSDYQKDNLEEAIKYVGLRINNKLLDALNRNDEAEVQRYQTFSERSRSLCGQLRINSSQQDLINQPVIDEPNRMQK